MIYLPDISETVDHHVIDHLITESDVDNYEPNSIVSCESELWMVLDVVDVRHVSMDLVT